MIPPRASPRIPPLLLLLALSCTRSEPPRWVRLVHAPGLRGPEPGAREVPGPGRPVEVSVEADHAWLAWPLERSDFAFQKERGLWRAEIPIRGAGAPAGSPPQRLEADGLELVYAAGPPASGKAEPRTFRAKQGHLWLSLAEGEEPPEHARLELYRARTAPAEAGSRVAGSRFSGEAIPVWPGERASVVIDVPAGSALRFATVLERGPEAPGDRRVTFRIRARGNPVFEHGVRADEPHAAWHEVPLAAGEDVEIAFEVEGDFSFTSFFVPVLGPAKTGTYGRRPWRSTRPDLILFVADTFRADNLATYGGRWEVTPRIDELARSGLVFRRSWSVSTHTLPAHASLFTGLYPRQVGVGGTRGAISGDVETLAELLSGIGYRTGAVTDSVIVSQRYGLDQGFGWFDEVLDPFESTLERARAFLEADDGRPVFLFVQSYRTHTPYEVSAATRASHGQRLGIARGFDELYAEYRRFLKERRKMPPEMTAELEALYRGGVADLDRGFGELHDMVEALGLLDSGYLVLTSDHGEAFDEHGVVFHSGATWEELLRVPLIVWGRDVETGMVDAPVSLVDLAPTLSVLAGVPPRAGWSGRPLLPPGRSEPPGSPRARPIFAFQCWGAERSSTLAVIQEGRKVFGREIPASGQPREPTHAFDLERDPAERRDLVESGADWPGELLARHSELIERLLEPLHQSAEARLTPARIDELRAMGYAE